MKFSQCNFVNAEENAKNNKICPTKLRLNIAACEGIEGWICETIDNSDVYDDVIDRVLKGFIVEIKAANISIEDQINELRNKMEKEISVRLSFYRKDEIFAALLAIKEYVRRHSLRQENEDWMYIEEVATVNVLMKFAGQILKFKNHSITELEFGCSNFMNAICWVRRYNLFQYNIDMSDKEERSIESLCFETVQEADTEKYFDLYLKNGKSEKQEDYIISNDILRQKLEEEGKTPKKILENLNPLVKKQFGFSLETLDFLSRELLLLEFPEKQQYWSWIRGERPIYDKLPVLVMEKKVLEASIGKRTLESLLETFSLNRNMEKKANELELFCFYEAHEYLIFGNFDFSQTKSIFEKFLISGHFIDIYKKDLSQNKDIKQAQRLISKYFSYCVADILFANGYVLPKETYRGKQCIRAEIDRIEVNNKNILIDENNHKLGDIDVLALNKSKKEILLFELKYYRPAFENKELFSRDKSLIVNKKVIQHMKEREKAVLKYSRNIVKFINGEVEDGYSVKSILITVRTNFYGLQETDVEYMTWAEFIGRMKEDKGI